MDVRRGLGAGAAAVLLAAGTGAQTAEATVCETGWGSTARGGPAHAPGPVTAVRAGRHACFDRVVVDVATPARGAYDVRYVPAVRADGSGNRVPLRGAADLQLVVRAPAYDPDSGRLVPRLGERRELAPTGGFRTVRQVAWAGSFEGQTTLGVGVRARLPFRVTVLPGPGRSSRVVVDVAHAW
jgi:hypothetical protein